MATKRSSYALLNGLRFHFLNWESDEEKFPVLLLHGLASNARIWDKVGPLLADAGCKVVAADQRGHGLTDKPSSGYDFEILSRDVAAMLDFWNLQRPILVGHSWGASVVLDFAARFPFGSYAPRGVIMVDGGLASLKNGDGDTWEKIRERLQPPPLAGMALETFLERLSAGQIGWIPDEDDLQIILANFEIKEDETIYPHLSQKNHLSVLKALYEFDPFNRLELVKCLVQAILAQPATPGNNEFYQRKTLGAVRAAEIKPDIDIVWMPNTIHDIPLQRAGDLADMISNFANGIPTA